MMLILCAGRRHVPDRQREERARELRPQRCVHASGLRRAVGHGVHCLSPCRSIFQSTDKHRPTRTDVCEMVRVNNVAACAHDLLTAPQNENKFKCPCHGSQYNFQGKVVRGPAPLSLALAHMDVKDDLVTFSPWCAICISST